MSGKQKSITSFFTKSPAGATKMPASPVNSTKRSARAMVSSSASDGDQSMDSPIKTTKRARKKKAVIESSSEDEAVVPPTESPTEVKENDTPNKSADNDANNESPKSATKGKATTKIKLKTTPRGGKKDQAAKKQKVKVEDDDDVSLSFPGDNATVVKSPKVKVKTATEVKTESSPEKTPKEEPKATSSKPKAPGAKNPFANFFTSSKKSEKTDSDTDNSKLALDFHEAVQKTKYHPISDAMWKRDQATPYMAFAKTLQAIEATKGRLKTIEILSNFFRSVLVLSPKDLLPCVNLCLNRLAPAYEGIELGIGESLLIKAIVQSTGRSAAQIKADAAKLGDLGLVAEASRGSQRTMFMPAALTVTKVFENLRDIAKMSGHSVMNQKVSKIQSMLVSCRDTEARYLIRSLAGKMRIGLAEQSVLQALAQACVMTPPCQEYPPAILSAFNDTSSEAFKSALDKNALILKTAYCECPNYDKVIPVLIEEGIAKLPEKCKLTPGIPLKPMLAHPTKGVQEVLSRFENAKFTCEWKYDGERAQIHLHSDGRINVYSRNQEDNTSKYPDVITRFANCKGEEVVSCVLDSEAVAWDRENKQILPFQVLSTRKRKDANEKDIKVQVAIFAFDLLYLNGEALVRKPFQERRDLLKKHFKEVEGEFLFAKYADPQTMEEVQEVLEESVKDKCEGLMVKTLDVDATYEIAKRSHNWLKLKKDYLDGVGDTLDLLVMGGYLGKGKRTGHYGGFLLGCYDPDNEEYQTICKIGTGFSDEDLAQHHAFFKDHLIPKAKPYYAYDSSLMPDHWFEPVQVWEVKAADLSVSPVHKAAAGTVDSDRGISLRFPRYIQIRTDKQPEDCTSAQQVADMYNSQEMVKNSKQSSKKNNDDDFDF